MPHRQHLIGKELRYVQKDKAGNFIPNLGKVFGKTLEDAFVTPIYSDMPESDFSVAFNKLNKWDQHSFILHYPLEESTFWLKDIVLDSRI